MYSTYVVIIPIKTYALVVVMSATWCLNIKSDDGGRIDMCMCMCMCDIFNGGLDVAWILIPVYSSVVSLELLVMFILI